MSGMRVRRLSRRAGLGGAGLLVTTVALAVPAWAFLSVSSSGATAAARVATLGTPGVATSGVSPTSVTFTVSAPATGPTPNGYRVARTAPSAVASVCTVSGANGSCTDTAPVAGQTNTYAVYAVLAGSAWESPVPAATSVAVPNGDTTPPVTTASQSPVPNAAGWSSTDVVVTLSASDASGVAGTWYTTDGSTPTTSSTRYAGPFTVSSSATVRYFSKDTAGNTEAVKALAVQIDRTTPTVAVTSPSGSSVQGGTVTVSGTAADTGSGVASVVVQYRAGSGTWTTIGSTTPSGSSWSTSWPTAGLADGSYSLQAVATDAAGNTTTSPAVPVTLRNTFTVTAPSTATAGTPFTVTLSTYPGYSGTHPVTVSGLRSSPNGSAPTLPTSATFTNGTATLSVTPVSSGSQTVGVSLSGAPLSNTSATAGNATVVTGAPTIATLGWASVAGGKNATCSATSCAVTLGTGQGNNSASATITAYDTYGNVAPSTATVTVTMTNLSTNATSTTSYVLAGGTAAWTTTETGSGNVSKRYVISFGTVQSIPLTVTR